MPTIVYAYLSLKKAEFPDIFYTYEHLEFHAHEKSFITFGPGFKAK